MGQRSQIYIHWDVDIGNGRRCEGLIARYFHWWNYGEKMVSRARSIMELLTEEFCKYPSLFDDSFRLTKLYRFCDINFDMRDVVLSMDILKEISEEWDGDMSHLFNQPCSDGQLYINIADAGIKYAFTMDRDDLMDAAGYMVADTGSSWNEYRDAEAFAYTKANIEAIDEIATLMTPAEMRRFQQTDYSKFLKKPAITYIAHKEEENK